MAPPVGYWETLGFSPSSVDFCEPNFERSAWVAEPWNAASSLPYVALGIFGVCVANPMRRAPAAHGWERPAFALAYLLTAVIGAGSVALHATMIAPGQAADEAPMLLLNAVLVFILCELGSGAAALRRPLQLCLRAAYALPQSTRDQSPSDRSNCRAHPTARSHLLAQALAPHQGRRRKRAPSSRHSAMPA